MDMWWECKQTKWKFWEKIERARQHKPVADVATIIRFLAKRKDAEGRPVIERLGSPQPQADGWWRLRWLEFTDDDILMLERHGLDKAWHGCKLEALYSILYHGRLRESRKLGDRWLQGLPGVYVHKPQTARKAENYMRFTPLCKDGVYWAAKGEVLVDRSQKVKVPKKKTISGYRKHRGQTRRALGVRAEPTRHEGLACHIGRVGPQAGMQPTGPRAHSRDSPGQEAGRQRRLSRKSCS